MLIECSYCDFFKSYDEGKIPPHIKVAICPKCRKKIKLPERTDLTIEYLINCESCGKDNVIYDYIEPDETYTCFGCGEIIDTSTRFVICPICSEKQRKEDRCLNCKADIAGYIKAVLSIVERKKEEEYKQRRKNDLGSAMRCLKHGKAIEVIDLLGNILSVPSKLLLLSRKIDNHMISSEVEARIVEFMVYHQLFDIEVRINRYDPKSEWKKIREKSQMNILIRIFLWFPLFWFYLLNPGRLFGGDFYNSAIKTVNIFSSHIGIALHELGHALDFKKRKFPGFYQLLRFVPLFALFQEYKASQYAIHFLRLKKLHEEELSAYKILYPAYSTYVFGAAFELLPSPVIIWLYFPFIITGHIAGHIHAYLRKQALLKMQEKGVVEDISYTRLIIEKAIEERKFKFDKIIFIAMTLGFICGYFIYKTLGGILGAVIFYYLMRLYHRLKLVLRQKV